jgi:hypothetical protein
MRTTLEEYAYELVVLLESIHSRSNILVRIHSKCCMHIMYVYYES